MRVLRYPPPDAFGVTLSPRERESFVVSYLVMLNLFQHPCMIPNHRTCWAMDPEINSG